MKIDFFARREHFVDHMLPVWQKLPKENRGEFYLHHSVVNYAIKCGLDYSEIVQLIKSDKPDSLMIEVYGDNPLVCSAYGDMVNAYKYNPNRVYILMEHGVGLTFGNNAGYAGGLGLRLAADCFLAPNEYIAKKTESVLDTTQYVIGTPKLDKWAGNSFHYTMPEKPTVCISFHWDGSHVAPEASNAASVFGTDHILSELQKEFNMIAHCHPKARDTYRPLFEKNGIEFVENFNDVMECADIYVNDASSTMYEFLVTGKPVILMNAPHFRKFINYGIRFWDYTNIGYQVKNLTELRKAIQDTIRDPNKFIKQRIKAVEDLYPHIGYSSQLAADSIIDFLERNEKMEEKLLKTKDYIKLKGLLSGVNNSTKGISNIEIEHLSWLGANMPMDSVAVEIGSHRGKSACCIASGIVHNNGNQIIHCVDIWEDGRGKTFDHYHSQETWEIFKRQVHDLGFDNIVVPHKSTSERASHSYSSWNSSGKQVPSIGLLFIDANHHEPFVEQDYMNWYRFIQPGGYVAFHDYGTRFPAVDRVVEEILKPSNLFEDYTVIGRIFSARKI